jgi:beta-galactosidase/beta-glucuronidase
MESLNPKKSSTTVKKHASVHVKRSLFYRSDEEPNLHEFSILLERDNSLLECVEPHYYFRKIGIRDGLLYLKGLRTKLMGVNRRETDPLAGSTSEMCQGEQALQLRNAANRNQVRLGAQGGRLLTSLLKLLTE